MAIASGIELGLNPVLAGRLLSFASFVAVALLLFFWSRTIVPARLAFLSASVSVVLTQQTLMVTSELLFLCAATIALMCSIRALRADRDTHLLGWWFAASTFAGFAFLVRYVGLASVVAVGALALAALAARRIRWPALIAASVPGGSIVAITFLRNFDASGHFGQAMPGARLFLETLPGSIRWTVAEFVRADVLQGSLRIVAIAKLAIFLMLAYLAVRSMRVAVKRISGAPWSPELTSTSVLAVFLVLTVGLTVAATAMIGMNLESRYLTVLSPWVLALIAAWACAASSSVGLRTRYLAPSLCVLWMLSEIVVVAIFIRGHSVGEAAARSSGLGYIEAAARSPGIEWVRRNTTAREVILTNRGADLAFWIPNPVLRLPLLPFSAAATRTLPELDSLATRFGARYLVHFRGYPNEAEYSRAEFEFIRQFDLPESFEGRVVAKFPETIIYRLGREVPP
jgi:hypothetical protein